MMRMRSLEVIALLLCLAGAWISGELVRLDANPQDGWFARACGTLDCDATLHTKWSRLSIPVPRPTRHLTVAVRRVEMPVAFVGLAYFVLMGIWLLLRGGNGATGVWHRLPRHVGLCALPVSAAMIGLMALGAAPWCLWCLAVHAINFALVLLVWPLTGRGGPTGGPATVVNMLPTRHALATIALALLVIGGLWWQHRAQQAHGRERDGLLHYKAIVAGLQEDPAFLLREHAAQPRHEFPLRPGETAADGHHTLVVFTDFECPACFCNAARIHDQVLGVFDGGIDLLIRHLPLGQSCNDGLSTDLHPNACRAAAAAESARLLGGQEAFQDMYRLLFLNRDRLGPDTYRDLAAQLDLDADDLERLMDSPEVCDRIAADVELANGIGVTRTPTMFLDGRRITELCRTPAFWKAAAAMPAGDAGVELAAAGATEQ